MRPVIGITAWRRRLPTFLGEQTDLYTLGTEYVEAVERAGGTALILPHGRAAGAVLDAVHGLLLSGGDDVHPESYGEALTDASFGVDEDVDRWELALVRGAASRGMPTLGICRGMQIMAVASGGKLLPHLADVDGHPDLYGMTPEEVLGVRHAVTLHDGCTLARVYGTSIREVNTIHHQAIADAGTLTVVGTGDGGVIEAVEALSDWPGWGVQWHPEKMRDGTENQLFEEFIAMASTYAKIPRSVAARS